ncbi:hypothetical protein [Iodidimonas sp. SYSU 1G8]|uniref:hypothetical protein n=1 Tax=Iodidimonas sp. SYSU 1G8 TaxID=3133967 RepID=UPI0031FE5785
MKSSSTPSPAVRARDRRSLIQLGSLLAMSLVIVGLLALFSVWSINRDHVANQKVMTEALFALDDGRSAQTLFKIQVQEWKNLLLRGSDRTDYARYHAAFEAEETRVRERLASLGERAGTLNMTSIRDAATQALDAHADLGRSYRAALAAAREEDWRPTQLDRSVRGIDRALNTALDEIAADLLKETERRRIAIMREEADRYQSLRGFMGWCVTLSVGLVGLVLWSALRNRHDRR